VRGSWSSISRQLPSALGSATVVVVVVIARSRVSLRAWRGSRGAPPFLDS
jgi:hypothetical protein